MISPYESDLRHELIFLIIRFLSSIQRQIFQSICLTDKDRWVEIKKGTRDHSIDAFSTNRCDFKQETGTLPDLLVVESVK